ncbi:septal ring lytic transglycosylase RlpA family protein [Oscillatoria salina]|uniref:septal ring lytic transglycosylase RlpA family protein n=1 Tax=Oscillatoria salina TaxID=331517 RepID=UPI0013B890A6|nr:septal ring lytic transglycosylase RlpA family protein [Oscillatoria salina]MBZ8179431.1 septal ring lytic transglycosylase RlpA family protein [Oscillatoria salina IIICB1]NET87829.1 septal ring lytic transglycosylase RlpA family protein [Kamptonema sp. SIO1D9]
MNQKIWSSLTAALLTTAFGITLPGHTAPVQPGADPDLEEQSLLATKLPLEVVNSTPQSSSDVLVTEYQSRRIADENENSPTKVYTHQWQGYLAATVYVNQIPVITFIGSTPLRSEDRKLVEEVEIPQTLYSNEGNQEIASNSSAYKNVSQDDPVWRATSLAARINQLSKDNIDARTIVVSWEEQRNSFIIKVGEEELVAFDQKTMLPDTTSDRAEDARQATNRLRRLLGNAAPLREVIGLPQQQPQRKTPTRQVAINRAGSQRGMASWYGPGFHGRRSASGERFNQNAMTAAHRSLPFGTMVRVTNLNNGRTAVVRINDRGPFIRGRVIDLSAGAARAIGMLNSGVAPVQLEIIER